MQQLTTRRLIPEAVWTGSVRPSQSTLALGCTEKLRNFYPHVQELNESSITGSLGGEIRFLPQVRYFERFGHPKWSFSYELWRSASARNRWLSGPRRMNPPSSNLSAHALSDGIIDVAAVMAGDGPLTPCM
jgi:hypothetical protein